MIFKLLKDLWKYSALPIVLFLLILISLVSFLQSKAVKIQSEPIVISITKYTAIESLNITNKTEEILQILIPLDKENLFNEIQLLLEKGQNKDAEILILDLEKTNDDKHVQFYKGLILNRNGNKKEAIEAYKKALDQDPNYYEAAINLGAIYLTAGRTDQSFSILERAVFMAGGEKRSRTLTLLGKAYNQAGFYEKAESSLVEAINLSPADLKSRLELGSVFIGANQISKAENIFNEVLLLDEYSGNAYNGLVTIKISEGKFSAAEVLLEKAITIIPAYDEGRELLADILFNTGRNVEAKTQLLWILDNGKDLSGASYQLGQIFYSEKDYIKAEEYYELSFESSNSTKMEAVNNLSLALKAQGKIDDAENVLLKAIEIDEYYVNAHYNLGLIYLDKEEPQLALDAFKIVITLDPEYEQAWYNIGFIHSQRGSITSSILAYEKTLNINPAYLKCRFNLAVQYKKDGQLDKAETQYDLILSTNPTYASAWYNLALLQKQRGELQDAEKAYMNAIKFEPEKSIYWSGLSSLYNIQGKGDDSIEILKEALDITPEDTFLRYKLAKTLDKYNLRNEAILEFKKLVSLDENYIKGWLGLASIQVDQKEYNEAQTSYEKVIKLDPNDDYSKYQLGKVLFSLNRFNESISYFKNALLTIIDNSWIWYHLGKAQQKLGKNEEADVSYNKSLSIDPKMGKFIVQKLEHTEDSKDLLETMILEDPENFILYIQIAQLYYRDGENENAKNALQNVADKKPKDSETWALLADTAMKGNDTIFAENAFRKAQEINPLDGNIRYSLAVLIKSRGDFDKAIIELKFAIPLLDTPEIALTTLGDLYYEIKDYTNAIDSYIKGLELNTSDKSLISSLGKAYYRNKQYRKALVSFNNNLELQPNDDWSHIWAGRAYARLERYDEAEREYKKSIEINPSFIQSYISLGDLEVQFNENPSALKYYEKALEINPLHKSVMSKITLIKNKK